ncbi:hypothetical protein ITX31_06845 [Arthrobacter gandavensis]|uniref:hypothetical protein n=1 Tax=Arthrobacter gandavensis TaxID=169960 RepID=UPI00188E7869|nr:hypothetical protein [Arthrobacter gandavensis]MBF4993827.1 hypothetical protein [Arthrobacter gandavensis]
MQGDTLVQVVDHEGGDFVYPIVADPWLGQDLYYTPYITTVSQGYKVNVTPRSWGQQWAGPATWFAHRDVLSGRKLGWVTAGEAGPFLATADPRNGGVALEPEPVSAVWDTLVDFILAAAQGAFDPR